MIQFIKELFCIHKYNLIMLAPVLHSIGGVVISYKKCKKCEKTKDGVIHE